MHTSYYDPRKNDPIGECCVPWLETGQLGVGVARSGSVVVQPLLGGKMAWVAAWITTKAIVKTAVAFLPLFNLVVSTKAWI